jgi:hypothetical protein
MKISCVCLLAELLRRAKAEIHFSPRATPLGILPDAEQSPPGDAAPTAAVKKRNRRSIVLVALLSRSKDLVRAPLLETWVATCLKGFQCKSQVL